MYKKIIVITAAITLAMGVTTIANAKEKDSNIVNSSVITQALELNQNINNEDIINEFENGNYTTMDNYMNNITNEEYQNMINYMKENGYTEMVEMMESIDREEMIVMHNAMGGAESCHGPNSNRNGMMGRNFN